jgi:hypothetical protein
LLGNSTERVVTLVRYQPVRIETLRKSLQLVKAVVGQQNPSDKDSHAE